MAYEISIPYPWAQPAPLSLETRELNHWSSREVPTSMFNILVCFCLQIKFQEEFDLFQTDHSLTTCGSGSYSQH